MIVANTTLPKSLFDQKVSVALVAQAVRVYLANQRKSSAHTKTRGEVEGSTRKIFRQKGTGKARHGSIRAPIFVGGGIAHGPDGLQNYELKMPQKMRRLAVLGALTQRARDKAVVIVTGEATGKTQEAAKLLKSLDKQTVTKPMIVMDNQKSVKLAWRNIAGATVVSWFDVNAYEVLAAKPLIITQPALEKLKKKYA